MKNLPYYLLVFSFIFISCSNESVDEVVAVEKDIKTPSEKEEEYRSTTPCDFSLVDIKANDSLIIDCILDLQGENFTLPSNVTFVFKGGDIINGSLKFDGGTIDSKLLSNRLSVSGNFKFTDNVFNFIPSRWDIIEGEISNDLATSNKNIIQDLINMSHDFGAKTFLIGAIDAYFKVDDPTSRITPENAAITLPANFTLKMSDKTHLHMQPNAFKRPTLLSVANGNDNVTIEGGNLYGDRDDHDYSSGGTHEWGHILRIKGTSNTTVRGVTFRDATGDALNISGLRHYFEFNHIASENITIVDNTFYNSRRINLSITSGNHITIEKNTFVDGGIDTGKSKGASPKCNLNIEPVRHWVNGEVNGEILEYEKVSHVYIRNNIQKGRGAFLTSQADTPIIFEGNEMESAITFSITNGVQIKNNTFRANEAAQVGGHAIAAGVSYTTDHRLVYDNEVSGNKIYGYRTGINIGGKGVNVHDNYIEARSGIQIGSGRGEGLVDSKIYNNTIIAEQYGITGGKLINNVEINGNIIDAGTFPLFFNTVNFDNGQENSTFKLFDNTLRGLKKNNDYLCKLSNLTKINGAIITTNTITGGIEIVGSKNLTLNENVVKSSSTDGIKFFNTPTMNSNLENNNFTISSNYQCIKEQTTLDSTVIFNNNSCN